jgi:Holliday junction resolvasome RuvABC endonuclease subunit
MLELPDSTAPFVVVALDPGSTNLGIAVLEDPLDGTDPCVRQAFTALLKDTNPAYAAVGELHGSRVARLMIMFDVVLDVLRTVKPHAVIIESNYLGRFATSFAALVECVAMVRSAVYQYDPFLPLHQVDPTTVKTGVGMKRIKGTTKDDVKNAVRQLKDLVWHVDLESLDEHSVDACAIGYYHLKNIL